MKCWWVNLQWTSTHSGLDFTRAGKLIQLQGDLQSNGNCKTALNAEKEINCRGTCMFKWLLYELFRGYASIYTVQVQRVFLTVFGNFINRETIKRLVRPYMNLGKDLAN